jgi:hypothetical protein
MIPAIDQRSNSYGFEPFNQASKPQFPWTMPPSPNTNFSIYHKNSNSTFLPTQPKQYVTGKAYKEMEMNPILEKTKPIQKQYRPDMGRGKILSDDRTDLMRERIQNL